MKRINEYISLDDWTRNNTQDTKVLVEMGAGFFNRLAPAHPNVQQKIGIEIYEPYIVNAKYHGAIKIHGDILNYRELLKGYEMDTAMIVDVLEHLDYETGVKWIESLKQDFKKILLMLPVGDFKQDSDITGHGGHQYQVHRSSWYPEQIEKLNFNENVISLFYYNWRNKTPRDHFDTGCYFGVWKNA